MGKLRDLMMASAALIRSQTPPAAVEAIVENGLFWCTPTTIVILERRNHALMVQAFDNNMEVATTSAVVFSSDSTSTEICATVMMLLNATEPSTIHATRKASPVGICGASLRSGIDIGVLATQKRLETTHYWLRDHAGAPANQSDDPQAAAVQQYLLYLSMLVDTVQSSMACLAGHELDRGVIIFQRLLVEYAIRAHYALRHPDYTLWLLTVAEAQDYEKRLKNSGADPAVLAAAVSKRQEVEQEFSALVGQAKADRWKDLQFKTMFEEIATSKQHVSLYRGPSVFIHGDPIGMREAFPVDTDGERKGVIRLSDAELNARLVDASYMIVEFLCAFRDGYPELRNDEEADFLISELLRENMVHSLRFPQHRSSDYLAQVRLELGLAK